VVFSFVLAQVVLAQTGSSMTSVPGKVSVAQTSQASAAITAVDAATRTITLKSMQGDEARVVAGPEVRNFAQLKVGDVVNVTYYESLVLELKKGGGLAVAKTEQAGAAGAKPGATPEGLFGRRVTIVGDVIRLDRATQTMTLKGPERTIELKARDPEQFSLMAVGDQIQATYSEALAVSVTPVTTQAPPKK
jgi:hypothetical protein